jgi:GNAT superfamily N-acetyltransferase
VAGFCELDRRKFPEIEIKFFGIMPEFLGHGLGTYFLDACVRLAWSYKPKRLWVRSDATDHPGAAATYEKVGFQTAQ